MSKPRLTRDAARAAAFFEVEVGEVSFKCRVPAAVELMAVGVLPPAITDQSIPEDERKEMWKKAAEEIGTRLAAGERDLNLALLGTMMVEPRLWRGEEERCPEDWVTPSTLGPFMDDLLTQCAPKIGYGEERRKALDFRDPDGAGANAAQDGASRREESASAA